MTPAQQEAAEFQESIAALSPEAQAAAIADRCMSLPIITFEEATGEPPPAKGE